MQDVLKFSDATTTKSGKIGLNYEESFEPVRVPTDR